MKNKISSALILLSIVFLLMLIIFWPRVQRLFIVNSFFEPDNIVHNFQDADELFPNSTIAASTQPLQLVTDAGYEFPEAFIHQTQTYDCVDFLESTSTEGLLIIHKDTIIYEQYSLGLQPDEKHISWSMSKSFIGTLVGIAVEQGKLKLDDEVTSLLPDFKGTGYEGVTVLDLLCMRSGVLFDENYGDFNSDINRFGRAFALGSSYRDFALSLRSEVEPGSRCHYVSIDTQMLGFLLSEVMGRTLTELLQEYIWEPMGMEYGAGWIIDDTDYEMALGGMLASLRDYAKLGLLYLHQGTLNGNKIISSDWVVTATARHPASEHNLFGYGYQWWIPPNDTGDFMMIGIYDQFVYVHPEKELVIAKLSADHNFRTNGKAIRSRHASFFQSVAATF